VSHTVLQFCKQSPSLCTFYLFFQYTAMLFCISRFSILITIYGIWSDNLLTLPSILNWPKRYQCGVAGNGCTCSNHFMTKSPQSYYTTFVVCGQARGQTLDRWSGLKKNPVFQATRPYLSEPADPRLFLRKYRFFCWGLSN